MDLKKKNNNSSFSLPAHILSAILSIGITALILWLATGMSIATVIADAFSLGFSIGFLLLATIAPAIFASPLILPALFLVSAGLILGAATVGIVWKLTSMFGADAGKPDGVTNEVLKTETESNPEVKQKSLESDLNKQNTGLVASISIGLTALISSGATVLMGLFASELIISASIIPIFLLGMATAILLLPPLIAFGAALDLPLLIFASLLGAGLAAGAAATSLAVYLKSGTRADADDVNSLKSSNASEHSQDSPTHSPRKIIDGLGVDKQNRSEHIPVRDMKNHKPVFKDPEATAKTSLINQNDEHLCDPLCGL